MTCRHGFLQVFLDPSYINKRQCSAGPAAVRGAQKNLAEVPMKLPNSFRRTAKSLRIKECTLCLGTVLVIAGSPILVSVMMLL